MAHTREQRDRLRVPLCGAKARTTGQPCRKFAGEGTDHFGIGRCRYHGGRTESHRRHAISVEVKRRMVTLGEPIEDITAPDALLRELSASAGHVEWLRQEVANIDNLTEREAEIIVKTYDAERDRKVRIAEACARAGVAEAIVRVKEAEAAQMVMTLKAVLGELRLTSGQRAAVGPALRKHAALLAGSEPDDEYDAQIQAALATDYPPEEDIAA